LGTEAIVSLIPIHFHFQKLSGRHQLRSSTFLFNHAVKSLLEKRHASKSQLHCHSLENMTSKQQLKIKSFIANANNHLNGIFLFFNSLNSKLFPGSRLINFFSSHFSSHKAYCKIKESKAAHHCKIDEIILNTLSNSNIIVIVTDASIRNNVAISITYVHFFSNSIKKMFNYAINIIITKAKLFTIRYRISQAIQVYKTSYIIVISDAIHAAQRIFDLSVHSYQ